MKASEKIEVEKKQMPIISFLLGIAVIASAAAYIIYRYMSDKAYHEKWKDYDDCGLA
ncbi:MAG: hypothetical protein RR497_06180 [Oscillospiraceae bacterium]